MSRALRLRCCRQKSGNGLVPRSSSLCWPFTCSLSVEMGSFSSVFGKRLVGKTWPSMADLDGSTGSEICPRRTGRLRVETSTGGAYGRSRRYEYVGRRGSCVMTLRFCGFRVDRRRVEISCPITDSAALYVLGTASIFLLD